jgi:hypothetical protein
VRRLYALPENEASFGLATFTLVFKHKIPLELAAGRRHRPHDLFGNQEVEGYLDNLERAVDHELAALGASGTFEAFTWARRLGHRLGLGCWAGAEAASPRHLDRLVPLFDRLDTSDSFVRPWRALFATATGKRIERAAMRGIEAVIGEILAERERTGARPGDYLQQMWDAWADAPAGERAVQVARDVMIIHMGAQSNLYAALAWTLVNVLLRAELFAKIASGRRRAARALRERIDPHGAELAHAAPGTATDRGARRRTRLSAPAGHVPGHDALAQQHERGARLDCVRPRPLRGPAAAPRASRSPRASS